MKPFIIHNLGSTNSTNLDAIELAKGGAPCGTVVVAEEQTCGSGRRGRHWHSPKGNLYFSIVLRKHLPIPTISFASALSVGLTIEQILNSVTVSPTINYKWPNDVLVDNKKICGVLLQTESTGNAISWIVCGIGVNICSSPEYATSLKEHYPDWKLPSNELLNMILENFSKIVDLFSANGFAPLRKLWLSKAYKIGENISVIASSGVVYEGKFIDIDMEGSIMLEACHNIYKISYGEVI